MDNAVRGAIINFVLRHRSILSTLCCGLSVYYSRDSLNLVDTLINMFTGTALTSSRLSHYLSINPGAVICAH